MNSRRSSLAAFRSLRLLKDSSLPWSCSTRASRCGAGAALGVERGRLVRVLAVGEVELLVEREHGCLGEAGGVPVGEPRRDRGVVGGARLEGTRREAPSRLGRDLAGTPELGQDVLVVGRAADGGDVREVLRRGPQHRRPADVDQLDGVLLGDALARDAVLERIEVDADDVEGLELVLRERRSVLGQVAPGEDGRMDAGVKRLDPAAEHLGEPGHVLDARDGEPLVLEEPRRAAARDQLEAELGQSLREGAEPGLVVDGEERPHAAVSSRTTRGSRSCSTAWTRARRVAGVSSGSTGTGSAAITAPVSTPSST